MRKIMIGMFLLFSASLARAQAPTAATDFTAAQVQAFIKDAPRDWGVLVEVSHQTFVNDRVYNPVDLRVHELHLGLRLEARVGQFNAKDANQTFAYIVARDRRILLLKKIARFRVLINGLCERRTEASQMRSAIRIRN